MPVKDPGPPAERGPPRCGSCRVLMIHLYSIAKWGRVRSPSKSPSPGLRHPSHGARSLALSSPHANPSGTIRPPRPLGGERWGGCGYSFNSLHFVGVLLWAAFSFLFIPPQRAPQAVRRANPPRRPSAGLLGPERQKPLDSTATYFPRRQRSMIT